MFYQYRRRIALTPRDQAFGIDIIPMGGAMLGNYLIQGQVDAQMRVGYHLPADFGATVLLRDFGYLPFPQQDGAGSSWGMYAFAGGGANFVARDLTLDGNTFAHSRSVDKRPVVPMARVRCIRMVLEIADVVFICNDGEGILWPERERGFRLSSLVVLFHVGTYEAPGFL